MKVIVSHCPIPEYGNNADNNVLESCNVVDITHNEIEPSNEIENNNDELDDTAYNDSELSDITDNKLNLPRKSSRMK
ncbi:unnamed protein product [Sphenostylis stenocarpa]|uniref:Uncharacterized protein n=1 Tax=Sphenostylis stenocarpa TaxID=92480 RepID=A0AA86TB65_9FABA|nr:unnamed protein product [Sphenostylis stenocarpa]